MALTPRRVRSFATDWTSIRPSPPPLNSLRMFAVISRTASARALTGLVGKASERGTYMGGAYST